MKRTLRNLGLGFALVFYSSPLVFAQTEKSYIGPPMDESKNWKFSTALTYERGDFGTSHNSETAYVPFTITRYFKPGNVSLTVPYLYQKSPPSVSALRGRPFQTNNRGGDVRSDSGVGDMLLSGSYYLLKEKTSPLDLSAMAQIKFPTADDTKGLGTGEFDETIGLESAKSLDDHWKLLGATYYTFLGDPTGINLNNEFAFDGGAGYQVSEPTFVSLVYEERTAIVKSQENPRSLIFGLDQKLESALSLFGNIRVGLSDGSPDIGLTTGLSSMF